MPGYALLAAGVLAGIVGAALGHVAAGIVAAIVLAAIGAVFVVKGLKADRAAQEALSAFLRAIELQVKLEGAVAEGQTQFARESVVIRDADSVGVEQDVIDLRVVLQPTQEFEELRMQGRLAAGKLENFNAPLAIHHALDASLQILKRNGVHSAAGARR